MSFSIDLYGPEFIKRAIALNLGDWSNADPIPPVTAAEIVAHFQSLDYVERFYPWLIGRCFTHPRTELQIEVNLYSGSLSLSVSYGPHSQEALEIIFSVAKSCAQSFDLAYLDPNSGEVVRD